jgi:acetyl-CoA acetyltransferase
VRVVPAEAGKIRPSGGRLPEYVYPFGATSAAHTLAQTAQRYFHTYGGSREILGWIALNQRSNTALNPTAIYRTPLTMDDYLSARKITTPFGLYDCDESTAVVVSSVEEARDLYCVPVYVEAVGTQITERLEWDQSTLTHEPQVLGQSAHMWSRTSLRPADVDVAELYDGFTINCLSWIEGLGFCGIGEAPSFLDGGKNVARDGVLPLNTHGGQLSHGRTHGMGLVHGAVTQLRGSAGCAAGTGRACGRGVHGRAGDQRRHAATGGRMTAAAGGPLTVLPPPAPDPLLFFHFLLLIHSLLLSHPLLFSHRRARPASRGRPRSGA